MLEVHSWDELNLTRLQRHWATLGRTQANVAKLTRGWWLRYLLLQVLDVD